MYPNPYMPIENKPIPLPDQNWIDHVQENQKYLKSIQKFNIHKDFEGLKKPMLFLMEVSTKSVEFNKEAAVTVSTNKQGFTFLKIFVKFLDFLFLEVNDEIVTRVSNDFGEFPSYSDLFQVMFTPRKPDVLIDSQEVKRETNENEIIVNNSVTEIKIEIKERKENNKSQDKTSTIKKSGQKKSVGKKERKFSKERSLHKITSGSKEKVSSKEVKSEKGSVLKEDVKSKKERENIKLSKDRNSVKEEKENKVEEVKRGSLTDNMPKGKAAFLVMDSLSLIRSLQEHPIRVKVVRYEEEKESEDTEGVTEKGPGLTSVPGIEKSEDPTLGTVAFRVPESLRMALLSFIKKNTPLPAKETYSDSCKLVDSKGNEVGKIIVTVSLTCFGKAVENCIREDMNGKEIKYAYDDTKCWQTFSEEKENISKMNPKLALHLMKTAAAVTPRYWTSEEILQYGVGWGLVEAEAEERWRILGPTCHWTNLVRQAKREVETTPVKPPRVLSKHEDRKSESGSSVDLLKSPCIVSSTVLFRYSYKPRLGIFSRTVIWSNYKMADVVRPTLDVEAIKQSTVNGHLNGLWRQQLVKNKQFKEQKEERMNRKNSLYERLERLKAEAPVYINENLEENTDQPHDIQEDIKFEINPETQI